MDLGLQRQKMAIAAPAIAIGGKTNSTTLVSEQSVQRVVRYGQDMVYPVLLGAHAPRKRLTSLYHHVAVVLVAISTSQKGNCASYTSALLYLRFRPP